MATIGENIKREREAKGMDEYALALAVSKTGTLCSKRDVGRWEADDNEPGPENLRGLAAALETTVDELLA